MKVCLSVMRPKAVASQHKRRAQKKETRKMTLENKLFELTTLVDYGTYYLSKEPRFTVRGIATYISENDIDPDEFYDAWDVSHCFYASDILSNMDTYDIKEYVKDNDLFDEESVLDNMSYSDILQYLEDSDETTIVDWVRDHYDARDLVDLDISVDWN